MEADSAREKLAARMEKASVPAEEDAPTAPRKRRRERAPAPSGGGADVIGDFLTSRQGKAVQRQVLRGVFGMLKKRL
ncbi:MAG: hypothetical protein H0U84_03885 [Thermoleophilaceae bacterium]|nr:hypothetical protein [Thermoleophilaceae bacterium]